MTHCMNAILLTLEVIFAIKPKLLTQIMCMKTWKRNNPVQILFTMTLHRSSLSAGQHSSPYVACWLWTAATTIWEVSHTQINLFSMNPQIQMGANLNATCVVTNPFLDKQCNRKQSKCAAIVCWLMVVMKKMWIFWDCVNINKLD